MELLREWANWKSNGAPFVLESDRADLSPAISAGIAVTIRNWPDAYQAPDFCKPGDHRLHLGLLPQPFLGDLRRASIYVLLLNPGLSPRDYYGEDRVGEYRKALVANLRQEFKRGSLPFLFLDPQYSWHSGFSWWHGKLAGVISCLSDVWAVSFAEARAWLARELASIELVPYHSPSFRDSGDWVKKLRSVALARALVHNVVVPRVRRGEAIVIVTRRARDWNMREGDFSKRESSKIVIYNEQEARAAHLSPKSRGGKAILRHLARKYQR